MPPFGRMRAWIVNGGHTTGEEKLSQLYFYVAPTTGCERRTGSDRDGDNSHSNEVSQRGMSQFVCDNRDNVRQDDGASENEEIAESGGAPTRECQYQKSRRDHKTDVEIC